MDSHTSHSPEETQALGRRFAKHAEKGWVVGLKGDLGAGKTQFVKGFAKGLGTTDTVRSPSFSLVNEYPSGRLALYHVDLYRLETHEEVIAAGLEPYLIDPDGITVVEWIDRWADAGPLDQTTGGHGSQLKWVHFEFISETERKILCEDPGD